MALRAFTVMVLAALLALAAPAPLSTAHAQGRRLMLFGANDLYGPRWDLGGEVADFSPFGWNDVPRSLVAEGPWLICEHIQFRGRCKIVQGEIRDLRAIGFSAAISSARPAAREDAWRSDSWRDDPGRDDDRYGRGRHGGWPHDGYGDNGWRRDDGRRPPTLVLFAEPRLRGWRLDLTGDEGDFPRRQFNDVARSLRAEGRWLVCEHTFFRGRCVEVAGVVDDLDRLGVGRQISSARFLGHGWDDGRGYGRGRDRDDDWRDGARGGYGGARLTLFDDRDFGGAAVSLDGGEGDLRRRGFNDRPDSLHAEGEWLICQHVSYGGRCERVRGRVRDLAAIGMAGQISSARPVDRW